MPCAHLCDKEIVFRQIVTVDGKRNAYRRVVRTRRCKHAILLRQKRAYNKFYARLCVTARNTYDLYVRLRKLFLRLSDEAFIARNLVYFCYAVGKKH